MLIFELKLIDDFEDLIGDVSLELGLFFNHIKIELYQLADGSSLYKSIKLKLVPLKALRR